MTIADYTCLINKPEAITEKQTEELGTVLNEFPYFQSARAVRLKGMYNENSFKYNYALKVTAAHTTDRAVLFDFITSDSFTSIQKEYYDEKLHHLLNITVVDSEIVSQDITKPESTDVSDVSSDSVEQFISSPATETVSFEENTESKALPSITTEISYPRTEITAPLPSDATIKTTDTTNDASVNISEEKIIAHEVAGIETDFIERSILESIKEASVITFEKTEEKTEDTQNSNTAITETQTEVIAEESADDYVNESISLTSDTPNKLAEEHLEIGKPLDFSINETHSFQEWLQLSRTQPIDRTKMGTSFQIQNEDTKMAETVIESKPIDEEKKKKEQIINKFIKTNPKIPPIKQTPITPTVQFGSPEEDNSYLMTETLARVYLEQKKYTKAIQAYEILILKYPEKISFFADRISDIKILQQNNNNN